jgi:hypothetical protein
MNKKNLKEYLQQLEVISILFFITRTHQLEFNQSEQLSHKKDEGSTTLPSSSTRQSLLKS